MEVDNKKNDQNIIPNDADKPQKGVNVPNLRFSEFDYFWLPTTLSSICSFRKKRKSSIKKFYVSTENILQNYKGIEQYNSNEVISGVEFLTGDILMANIRPYLKKVYMAEFDGVSNSDVLIFKSDMVDSNFLHCILANDNFINYVMNSVKGSKMPRGDKIHIMNYHLSIPKAKEQEKIAKFIDLINQRIDTQSKIIEDLELFKKSIENQYFYCDKSNDYASLGDIITQLNSRNEQNKDFEVLSVSNKYGFIPQSEQFDDHEVASANRSNYKIVKQNDFAYNPARINVGSIAMLRRNKIGIVSPMYICFRANNNKILSSYLDYFTHSNKFNKEVLKNLEGSVRLCLSFESLSKIKIYVPSLSTQYEIVKNLDLISNKIFIENKILEKLKEQKKYLLSNMFI